MNFQSKNRSDVNTKFTGQGRSWPRYSLSIDPNGLAVSCAGRREFPIGNCYKLYCYTILRYDKVKLVSIKKH